MYICICHQVTDKDIKLATEQGCCQFSDLQQKTGLGTQCGSCCPLAQNIFNESLNEIKEIERSGSRK